MSTTAALPVQGVTLGAGRNAYIDTLRGWAIFGVTCVHYAGSYVSTTNAWSPSFYLGLTLNQLFSFAVPLFLFLSGQLAGASSKTPGLGEYYRNRIWRIGRPYLYASIASFFLLNHYAEWLALPDFHARMVWLVQRFFFYGVEPTLYFIPLIIQLYFLQPALKALPGWLHRAVPGLSVERCAVLLTVLLLAAHVTIGLLCNRGVLSYYVWGRPNVCFWMFYFFAGLHFRSLTTTLSPRRLRLGCGVLLTIAAVAMIGNARQLLDRTVVGANFELNRLDFAYVRSEMLVYDLAMVLGLAAGIKLGWNPRAGIVSYLGRYTLEIYLWHILVLYYGAWRYADVFESCQRQPELIVLICAGTCLLIAGLADGWERLKTYLRGHQLAIVEAE